MRGLGIGVFAGGLIAFHVMASVLPARAPDGAIDWGCFATASSPPGNCARGVVVVRPDIIGAAVTPSQPSNLSSAVAGRSVTLQWTRPAAGDPADSYVIEAGSSAGRGDLATFDTGNAATALTVADVPAGTYFVRVRARNSGGVSGASNEIVVNVIGTVSCAGVPNAPTALTGSVLGTSVTLTWTAAASGCAPTGYIIEAGSASGQSNLASFSTGSVATSYSTSGVPSGTYYVRVRAANNAGQSGVTNELTLTVASGQSQWVSIGPSPLAYQNSPTNAACFSSGRVADIAVDPGDGRHWVIGVGNGGVWGTRDSGTSWTPLTDAAPTLATGAVAFARSSPNVLYAGTGEPGEGDGFQDAGIGVLKSTDGGQSWTLIGQSSFARASVKRLRVHPGTADIVLAATSRGGFGRNSAEGATPSQPPFGILKSTNGGATWRRTLAGQATALEFDPTNFNNQYAAIGDQRLGVIFNDTPGAVTNGVYRSIDGGESWVLVDGPWGTLVSTTMSTVGRIELAIAPSNPNVLYASIQIPPNQGTSSTDLLGLYRTDNAWATTPTWIRVPTDATGPGGYCGPRKCGYAHVISVDPLDSNRLFAGGAELGFFRCSNCGTSPTWTNVTASGDNRCVHTDHHALAWAGNRLIDGNDGGVWSTADLGASWQNHNRNITTGMFYSGALHPTDSTFMLGGLRDFSVSVRRQGSTWLVTPMPVNGVEWGEAEVALSSTHPGTDWMGAWLFGTISRTTNGGQSTIQADIGIDKVGAAFVAPVRKCPNDDNVFLTGTNRMWRTNNFFNSSAPSWAQNGPADPFPNPGGLYAPGTILAIAFVATDTKCDIYAFGTRGGGIQLTRDGGGTWTDLDPRKTLPARPVNSLAFDPANPNVLYAALSNFDDATPGRSGHVFKTTNAWATPPSWTNVSPPIDVPFNVVALDPRNPQLVYGGSDTGLWHSTDGGASWVRDGGNVGLPPASIYDIQINPATNMTVVFTYGRGAYQLVQ